MVFSIGYSDNIWRDLLRKEVHRLATFRDWQSEYPKGDLAHAGFVYTQDGDDVECVFCGIVIGEWQLVDNAIDEHRKYSPQCQLINYYDVGNVPIGNDPFGGAMKYPHIDCGFRKGYYLNIKPQIEAMEAFNITKGPYNRNDSKEYRGTQTCVICLDSPASEINLPCRHMVACRACHNKLDTCAVCREPITACVSLQ